MVVKMKIKYLKNAPLGEVGEIADIDESEANVLIKLGFAENYQEPKPKTKPKKDTKDEPT